MISAGALAILGANAEVKDGARPGFAFRTNTNRSALLPR